MVLLFFHFALVFIFCMNDFFLFFDKMSEHKLFIGMLPKNVSDAEVSELFSNYGTITDLQLLRGYQQTSKGKGFLFSSHFGWFFSCFFGVFCKYVGFCISY